MCNTSQSTNRNHIDAKKAEARVELVLIDVIIAAMPVIFFKVSIVNTTWENSGKKICLEGPNRTHLEYLGYKK